ETIHGLLLLVAVGIVAYGVWQYRKTRQKASLVGALLGVVVAAWYFSTESIPEDLTGMTPYLTTLLVLALFSQRLRMPAADGKPYRRGSAG
ncbi:MAG: transporter permease, partial [Aeromicrobium sp.]|nr:transporter permease [Aeromicrobium sp.]